MIHLFLVIHPILNTIVKILINASPLVVNKYTSNGLFCACIATIWQLECTTCSIKARSMGVITRVNFRILKVSFVSCLYKLILYLHVSLTAPDPAVHADYSDNLYKKGSQPVT